MFEKVEKNFKFLRKLATWILYFMSRGHFLGNKFNSSWWIALTISKSEKYRAPFSFITKLSTVGHGNFDNFISLQILISFSVTRSVMSRASAWISFSSTFYSRAIGILLNGCYTDFILVLIDSFTLMLGMFENGLTFSTWLTRYVPSFSG